MFQFDIKIFDPQGVLPPLTNSGGGRKKRDIRYGRGARPKGKRSATQKSNMRSSKTTTNISQLEALLGKEAADEFRKQQGN